jgi:hypothetical protein
MGHKSSHRSNRGLSHVVVGQVKSSPDISLLPVAADRSRTAIDNPISSEGILRQGYPAVGEGGGFSKGLGGGNIGLEPGSFQLLTLGGQMGKKRGRVADDYSVQPFPVPPKAVVVGLIGWPRPDVERFVNADWLEQPATRGGGARYPVANRSRR